jgi:hypothetical protein
MAGLLITNYQFPPKKFQFLLAPLYGTQSKSLNYTFRVGYTLFPQKIFSRIHFALSGMKFNTNDFKTSDNRKYITGFQKIVPSVKLLLRNDNPRSTVEKFIQWKSFWIEEDNLRFSFDTVEKVTKVLGRRIQDRWLHQLQFVWKNTRVLYPYSAIVMAERSSDFTRLSFTGNTYLNYNDKLYSVPKCFQTPKFNLQTAIKIIDFKNKWSENKNNELVKGPEDEESNANRIRKIQAATTYEEVDNIVKDIKKKSLKKSNE